MQRRIVSAAARILVSKAENTKEWHGNTQWPRPLLPRPPPSVSPYTDHCTIGPSCSDPMNAMSAAEAEKQNPGRLGTSTRHSSNDQPSTEPDALQGQFVDGEGGPNCAEGSAYVYLEIPKRVT